MKKNPKKTMKRGYRGPRLRFRGKRRRTAEESTSDPVVDCVSSDEEDYVPSSSDFDSDGEESGYEKRKKVMAEGGRKEEREPSIELGEDGEQKDEVLAVSDYEDIRDIDLNALPRREKKKKGRKKKDDAPPLLWEVWEEETEKWINEHEKDDIDLEGNEENKTEVAEQPPEIIMPLLRFQREWLAWALKQEESEIGGGILADEMGMGKTIQAISLVLAARAAHSKGCDSSPSLPSSSTALPKIKSTLVICPLVALIQWQEEIAKFTREGSARILVYYGSKRSNRPEEFSKYDFVLTTYSTVEGGYRKNMMAPKERCQLCGKLFYPKKMTYHLMYFCGPDAEKTEKQSKQGKKEKQPTKAARDRTDEVKVGKGKRNGKTKTNDRSPKKASNNESTVAGEGPSSTSKSILHCVKWERIILDEAHYIKDRRCNTAKAVFSLESSYKWALSGTPLQNRVGELYSLIRFLQISPYSYYFCKDCDCKCLDYSFTMTCPSCRHSATRHFCWWNKYIATPIQVRGSLDDGRRAMLLLRQKLLKGIVLRRTKKGRAADLALPPRIVTLRRDIFDSKEEDYYDALYTQSQAQFNTYIDANTLMNNYAHIFDLLTRLRQAVDHPYLVVYSNSRTESLSDEHKGENVEACGICHDPAEDPVVTSCEHVFCKACLNDYSSALGAVTCPLCLKPLTVDFKNAGDRSTTIKGFKRSSILNRINLDDFQTSTKIEALREEIRFMIERDGSAKGIVFSQFTSFLDLIKYSLQKSGVQCVQLVGSMSLAARDDAIKKFTDDPDCKIFLMSLKAGGVALNLTVASYVFLMDPWWNPAVERQAQDRIHRIGQHRPIRIMRFIIENTIEERILRLQAKKELVFEGTIGGSKDALGKLTEADLRFLFTN